MRFSSSFFFILLVILSMVVGRTATVRAGEGSKIPRVVPGSVFDGHVSNVNELIFASEDRNVISVCSKDLRIWDSATGKEIENVKGVGGRTVALSSDGKFFATAGKENVTLGVTADRKNRTLLDPHGNWNRDFPFRPVILAMAYSKDGSRFATAGSLAKVGGRHGYPGGVLTVWDSKTGKELYRFDNLSTSASSAAFSSNGKLVAVGTNGAGGELAEPGFIRIWDLEKGLERHSFRAIEDSMPGDLISVSNIAFCPQNKRVAAAIGTGSRAQPAGLLSKESPSNICIWDLESGKKVAELQGHTRSVGRMTFSPDGKILASAGDDRQVRLWETRMWKQAHALTSESTSINSLAFSSDSRRLAVGGGRLGKGMVQIWLLENFE